jgi:hypothetical protein
MAVDSIRGRQEGGKRQFNGFPSRNETWTRIFFDAGTEPTKKAGTNPMIRSGWNFCSP